MGRYANKTAVSPSRSVEEIDRILRRYKATQFATGWDEEHGRGLVSFKVNSISYKLEIPIPQKDELKIGPRNRRRTQLQIDGVWEQIYRQRWRAMALVIKAKLEAVECGISTFEQEFMTNIMLPGGQTVRDFLAPQLEYAIEHGTLPKGSPMLEGPKIK